ncbi:MAG TPA: AAA family ATPase, partial [Myxococcota bacterium]|nr:AAA family ATPase [Myxococcota bacterium]
APFVGRDAALATLREAWSEARSARGGLALVSGPPGVGKTRLGQVFAAEAERAGGLVLTGASRDGEGVPAFWLWAQVLRRLLASAPEPEVVAELEGAGAELAGLVPGLAPAGADLAAGAERRGPDASVGPELSRFLLFDAVSRALCRASRQRPLLVLLDDLQWAGSPSLRLLEHLGHDLLDAAILVVAGVREEPRAADHPLELALPILRRHARCTEIALRGFARRDVAQWLEQVLGRPPPPDLSSTLYARTEGVPLFVREAIRLLAERGDLRHPEQVRHWSVTIPGEAFDLIRRPLASLSPEAAALIGAAAVIGRDFTLPFVASVAELPREKALDLLDEALRAGVIERTGEAAGGHRFVHALFREAALAAVPAGARALLHARAAEHLERRHAAGLDAVIAEVAHHSHAAVAAGGAEQAWAAATRAAERATRVLAWEQAALHHEQAVAALDAADAPDPERRLAATLALGEALRRSGDRERRLAAFARALDAARSLGRPRELALAAIGACDLSEWAPADPAARAALEEALAALGEEPSVESARARARLAYLSVRNPGVDAESQARRAVAEARAIGDFPALQ